MKLLAQLPAQLSVLFAALLGLAACRSTPSSSAPAAPAQVPAPSTAPAASAAPARTVAPAPGYTLVLIKTGPMSGKLDKAANDAAFVGHFENMGRLAKAEQLVVAGPFGQVRHDPELRGIFVLATADRAEAERWASTDPTTQAGVFVLEYHDLATDAPLVAALRADSERRARLEAAGTKSAPGDGARAYVLLFAEHGDAARRELAPLCTPEGGVYMIADLDHTRAFALLDAGTQAEAAERFAPQLAAMGSHALSEWFASDMLARMVEPAGSGQP